ncbi:MAG: putative CoA-binding protein [Marinoscillum sp.]|jgi:predicted CoA-binding protein
MSDQNPVTVVIGATPNPSRYAYLATSRLVEKGHKVVPIGIKEGEISKVEILDLRKKPKVENVDTVTLYLGPSNQTEWIEYIYSLAPRRIIFNPGTENEEFMRQASSNGIECLAACTLVMLSANTY